MKYLFLALLTTVNLCFATNELPFKASEIEEVEYREHGELKITFKHDTAEELLTETILISFPCSVPVTTYCQEGMGCAVRANEGDMTYSITAIPSQDVDLAQAFEFVTLALKSNLDIKVVDAGFSLDNQGNPHYRLGWLKDGKFTGLNAVKGNHFVILTSTETQNIEDISWVLLVTEAFNSTLVLIDKNG